MTVSDVRQITTMAPSEDHYRRILNWENSQTRRWGQPRLARYLQNRQYYFGQNPEADDVKQPLGVRYIPNLHQKHVHYLFGEWERDVVSWLVTPFEADDEPDPKDPLWQKANQIQRTLIRLMRRAEINDVLMRGALDGSIYGDTVFKVSWDPLAFRVRIEAILPEYYHCIWHPLNPNQTLEACVAYSLDRPTAQSMFGTPGNPGFLPVGAGLHPQLATCWEWWSPYETIMAVDDQIVSRRPNIFATVMGDEVQPGFLPFIHIPNLPVNGEYWGFGDCEPVFKLADELNYRLADLGDVINYHAHPITLLEGFYGKTEDLPVAVDAVWNLGREGKASYLEWKGPPPEVMEYIEMLMRIMLETSSLTMVAFGRIEQSQASSAALNIQMLPISEITMRRRAVWTPRLRDLAIKFLTMESVAMGVMHELDPMLPTFETKYGFSIADLKDFDIQPKWAPIIPRDRLAVVNEQVSLLTNKARSIMQALMELGVDDPVMEYSRIFDDMKKILELEAEVNMKIAEHEARLNQELAETQAESEIELARLQMKASAQQHRQAMEQDPTTDPERHARHVERIRTEGEEERKTLETKARVAERTAAVKARRVSVQRGGKNSKRAEGGSNTDGGD